MSTLQKLRLLGQDQWVRAGRFEVNTKTGERRPIPGLELGVLAEDVETEAPKWGLGTLAKDLGQGVANIPGAVADAGFYASQLPSKLIEPLVPEGVIKALGGSDAEGRKKEAEELRAGYEGFVDPYRRAKQGIAPAVPAFSDAPIQASIRGALQSAPETLAIALTGGVGQAASTAKHADLAYGEMRDRQVPDYIAAPASVAIGGIQGLLDRVGAEGAFKGATGNLVGRLARGGALEGLTETAQEAVGIGGETLTGKELQIAEARERLSSSFAGGFLVGGALGGGSMAGASDPKTTARALEERTFPARRLTDYAQIAAQDPRRAIGQALMDAGQGVSPQIKREMILDPQTELSLKGEWDKARDRINADPDAAVIRLDLDGVKAGNDNLGHDVADATIFRPMADAVHAVADEFGIGERLRFRAGGDEFILVVPKDVAPQVADRLKQATAPRFAEVPADKAIAAGLVPGEAFVQYGASVGWGMDDHSADQEVYKIKAARPERGKLVTRNVAENQLIYHLAPQQFAAPPVEVEKAEEAPQEPQKKLSRREAMAASGLLMAAPIDSINAAIGGAADMLATAKRVQQKWATAEGNLPLPWMHAKEKAEQAQRAAKLETSYLVDDYRAALKTAFKDGALPEEVNSAAKAYLEGDREASVPEGMKPVLDQMRTYIDESISQELINSGLAKSPAHAAAILANKGKYLYRAFRMHIEPEFKKQMVGTPTFEKAVDDTILREDRFLQGVVDTRNELAAEYEGRANVLAFQQAKAQEIIAAREQAVAGVQAEKREALAGRAASEAEAALQEDLAALSEYEAQFGPQAPGLEWAKNRLIAEYETAKTPRPSREARQDLDFAALAMEGDIRRQAAEQIGEVFADSNLPAPAAPLDYGRRELRSRVAAEREALRQRYAKKLGIAKNRAAWAEKKIAGNATNPQRRAEVAGEVEGMISFDPRPISPSGLQGLSKAWLSRRKDIPQSYLDVMGEYKDPVAPFVISAERAARTIAKRRMWDDIILGAKDDEISVGKRMPGLARAIEGVTATAPDGSEVPVYTSDELYEALNDAFDVGHQAAGLSRVIDVLNGGLKANATIFSVSGAMRNAWSAGFPLLANGNLLPLMYRHGKSAFQVAAANAGWGHKEWRQEAVEAAKWGIVGTNVDTRDLERYFRSVTEDPTSRTPLKSGYKLVKDFYSLGDNLAKMATWKSERDRYAKAMGLPRDSPEVMARAAEVTKRVIQNYDRLPRWAKKVREAPFVGPFVSFPAAVISNVAGSYRTIAEDMQSDKPGVRLAGRVRAAWFASTMVGLAAGEEIFRAAFKDDDDDAKDQEVLDDIRPLLPPWHQNSQMVLYDKSGGYVRYLDMSFLNYYGVVTDPISAMLRGDFSLEEVPAKLGQVALGTASKIFGEELALKAYADLTRGPAGGGPEVVNSEMSPELILWRVGEWAMRNAAPGTLRDFYKAYEAEPGHRLSQLTNLLGFKLSAVNLGKALDYSLYEAASDSRALQESMKGAVKSTSALSLPEFEVNVQGYQGSMTSVYSQALDKYQRAVRNGADPAEARQSLGDKLGKSGKVMVSLLALGNPPEDAVKRAVEFDWNKQRENLAKRIATMEKEALVGYQEKYPDATQLEIERQKKYLAEWSAKAKQIAMGTPGQAPQAPPAGPPAKKTALERLKELRGN